MIFSEYLEIFRFKSSYLSLIVLLFSLIGLVFGVVAEISMFKIWGCSAAPAQVELQAQLQNLETESKSSHEYICYILKNYLMNISKLDL
jgi:hypothetical protein